MKLIKKITELNKAINKEKDLGFVPTMGSIHKGHESLIKTSKKKCKKTLVSIFINPTQFNKIDDFKNYPRSLSKDLIKLKRLKVDFIYLPTANQIYKTKRLTEIALKTSEKIMCAKYRKGHFEGVLDVLDRFVKQINPKIMFMGEKDYQQYYLSKNFITKKYSTKIFPCKTIRNSNSMALSSRNKLLNRTQIIIAGKIAKRLMRLKNSLYKDNYSNIVSLKATNKVLKEEKIRLTNKFDIKIEYLECRNLINLGLDLHKRPFKLFISYYLNTIRLIDNF